MKPDAILLARLYCGVAAALLLGFGFAAWTSAADASNAGVMTCGVGLFVALGVVAKPTRLLAIVIFCGLFAAFAFAAEVTQLAWHDEPPGGDALTRWLVEAMAGGLSWRLAQPLFRVVTGPP